jgi:sugar lactone lactonase YvrE
MKRLLILVVVLISSMAPIAFSAGVHDSGGACQVVSVANWNFGSKLDLREGSAHGELSFNRPRALTVDSLGNIYVGDSVNYEVVKFDKQGKHLLTIDLQPPMHQEPGAQLADIIEHMGYVISALAHDTHNNVYVLNRYSNRIEIYSPAGKFLRSVAIALDGVLQNHWDRMDIDRDGQIYVSNQIWMQGEGSIYDSNGRPVKEHIPGDDWPKYFHASDMVGYSGYKPKMIEDRKGGVILLRDAVEVDRCVGPAINTSLQYYVDDKARVYGIAGHTNKTGDFQFFVRVIQMHPHIK